MADAQPQDDTTQLAQKTAALSIKNAKPLPEYAEKDKEKFKMNFDDKLENGPVEDRGCTDIICCFIFLAFLITWIVIFAYGVSQGDPKKLFIPFNENKKGCGYSDGFKDYKYLFFHQFGKTTSEFTTSLPSEDLTTAHVTGGFCVSECPGSNVTSDSTIQSLRIKCLTDLGSTKTKENQECSSYKVYNSTTWFDGYCVPAFATLQDTVKRYSKDLVKALEDSETLQKWANDVKICWWVFIVAFFITIIISVVYMYFLKLCAGVITWLMIIFLIGVFIIGGCMSWNWAKMKETQNALVADNSAEGSIE